MDKISHHKHIDRPPFGEIGVPHPKYRGLKEHSLYITMRDGVKLAVDITLPETLSPSDKIPALLSQTRYWRSFELRAPFKWFLDPERLNPRSDGFKLFFTSRGYALVSVDVRGTGASFGTWPYPWDEDSIKDSIELVDWIISQPWSNGNVGAYGISYLGTTAELLAATQHPAIKAVIPMFNHPDPYVDIAYPGGILNDRFIKAWGKFDQELDNNTPPQIFGSLGRMILKGVRPVDGDNNRNLLRSAVYSHAKNGNVYHVATEITFRDDKINSLDRTIDDIALFRFNDRIEGSNTAIFGWGSWMDAGTADAVIRRFMTFKNAKQAVIGAWEHGGIYHASPYHPSNKFTKPTIPSQWKEMVHFFDAYLKEVDNEIHTERILLYYTMGEERWKKTTTWPPEGMQYEHWFLGSGNSLSQQLPEKDSGEDRYTIDYEATTGKHNRWWELGPIGGNTIIYRDLNHSNSRYINYTSPPLNEQTEITGYPIITLYVSSTEEDVAIYIYLQDIHPDGEVSYITEGQLRGIHRKISQEDSPFKLMTPYHTFKRKDAMPLVPGEIAKISFGLLPTSMLIKKGHRLRISIAGHDKGTFPRIPKKGNPIITIFRNHYYPSSIEIPIIKKR